MPKKKSVGRNEQLKKEFQSAVDSHKTPNEILKIFKTMEPHFEDEDLIEELMRLAKLFDGDPEKAMSFGKRVLKVMLDEENKVSPQFGLSDCGCTYPSSSFTLSCALIVLTKASLGLSWYNESLAYAKWADRNFRILLRRTCDSCSPTLILQSLVVIQRLMAKVKEAMGRKAEVPGHLIEVVGLKEKMSGEWSIELAEDYKQVSLAYSAIGNVKEAIHFTLKLTRIYERHLGLLPKEVSSVPNNENGNLLTESGSNEEAMEMLSQMEKRVAESRALASPQPKDGEDISEAISKCSISDDNEKIYE